MSTALMSTLFELSSLLVMPFWVLVILAPAWGWTHRILRSPLVVVPAALLYAVLVLPSIADILPVVVSPELAAIAELLGEPDGVTIAWVHFLAFDLFVGRWVYLDARERGLPIWVSSPVLFFVLMLGPFGFLLHLGARRLFRGRTGEVS